MRAHAPVRSVLACVLAAAAVVAGCAPPPGAAKPLRLRRVVLYQNGIGYFERNGLLAGDRLTFRLATHELDDVLKTLTIVARTGRGAVAAVASARPVRAGTGRTDAATSIVEVKLAEGSGRDLVIAYTTPTPAWKPSYRVYVEAGDEAGALVQGWASVNNLSEEDWTDVELTLSTGAPLSFAVDLHTPEFVARPDVNGTLVKPVAVAAVEAERTIGPSAGDRDADGLPDADDLCPAEGEDRDGWEDGDGCPDPDNDRDRTPDRDDSCPNEPETYNGMDDEDGCPDRGRVIVTDSAIEILDVIYFAAGSGDVQPQALPIVDAIGATLQGNPEIALVELGAHASDEEADAWALSARRAAAVRAALVERGVSAARLRVVPYGATQPVDARKDANGRARNRRVAFRILERAGDERGDGAAPAPAIRADSAEASARAETRPRDVAGTVRYEFGHPVTISRGANALLTILNHRVPGGEVFLFRPDAGAPGSEVHPFRAVRFQNETGFTLEPGPVAFFARGAFVGEGLLGRLDLGATAFIPFALDSSAAVEVARDAELRPRRVLAVARGVATVEDTDVRITRYAVSCGREAPARLYLRHPRASGYEPADLPPGTESTADAYLLPIPIVAGKTSTFTVEERRPVRRSIAIADGGGGRVELYLGTGAALPPDAERLLRDALKLRAELTRIEEELEGLRSGFSDVASEAAEIQGSLRSIERTRGAADLRARLVARLTETTARSEELSRKLAAATAAAAEARARLQEALRELVLEEKR